MDVNFIYNKTVLLHTVCCSVTNFPVQWHVWKSLVKHQTSSFGILGHFCFFPCIEVIMSSIEGLKKWTLNLISLQNWHLKSGLHSCIYL